MKKKLFAVLVVFTAVLAIGVGSATAFENVTAQEAYDMVNSGQATLIDVRNPGRSCMGWKPCLGARR